MAFSPASFKTKLAAAGGGARPSLYKVAINESLGANSLSETEVLLVKAANMPASNISKNMDYLFAITAEDIPSALLECTQKNTKSIIIDFTNLTFIEKELYELGENQVIFNDHNILFHKLRFFLKEKKFDDTFGNWNYMLNEIKSFDDFNGSKRVGEYIFNLISFIDQNYDVKDSIKKTNLLFKKKYGNDKVIELVLNE